MRREILLGQNNIYEFDAEFILTYQTVFVILIYYEKWLNCLWFPCNSLREMKK